MFYELFNNLAITSALLFIAGRFFQDRPLNIHSSTNLKILVGIASGISGTILMLSSIQVTGTQVIVDLRHLAIVLAAMFGGPIASIIAGLIIGIMRILLTGLSSPAMVACLLAVISGILFGYISTLKISRMLKYFSMNTLYVTAGSLLIYLFVDNPIMAQKVLSYYVLMTIFAGIFTFFVAEFIKKSNENHRAIFFYQTIAENAMDMISTHELDGTFKYVSPSSKKILGYEPNELVGKNPYFFHHPDDIKNIQESHKSIQNEQIDYTVEYRFKHKNGSYLWLETTSRRMEGLTDVKEEIICFSRDITLRKQIEESLIEANNRLRDLSDLDGLTQIHNRRYFDRRLEEEWKKATETQSPISLILFDIDNFKNYNDTYGHLQGDECIKEVAHAGQNVLIGPNEWIARYGGEEFAVILFDTNEERAGVVAEAIRTNVLVQAIPHITSKTKPIVTISVGAATIYPSAEGNLLQLIKNADEALYQAKEEGRNRVVLF